MYLNKLKEMHEIYKSKLYVQVQMDSAGIYAKQALQEAEKITYTAGIAKAYKNLIDRQCILQTGFASTEKLFDSSLTHFIKKGI